MGKGRHTQDRMFITHKEWSEHYGGHRDKKGSAVKSLPFNCCALSLAPFENPVMTADGTVFELTQIIPFIRKHRKHPVTGEPLTGKDIITLNFHKNTEGQYACPVTGKVFTENSKIVAIRTTGNVYSKDAVDTLCVAAKNYKDLLTDAPFTKADIVTLQDPSSEEWLKRRDVNSFFHVRASAAGGVSGGGASGGGAAGGAGSSSDLIATGSASGGTIRADEATRKVLAELAERERDGTLPTITGQKRKREGEGGAADASAAGAGDGAPASSAPRHVTGYGVKTTGQYTASFTSTGVSLTTRNEAAPETPQDRLEKRWAAVRALGRKAYVRLHTSKGAINLELHADLAPRCVDNFLTLARRGYFNGTRFHRLIRNFMLQGGDPTGTGRGGESAWGEPFRDEFHPKLTHGERGVLSMANSGPDSNRSQFFLTFRSAPHLDGKHSVFGRVVGGLDVLRELELAPTDKEDRPTEPLELTSVTVFQDPFAEHEAAVAAAAERAAAAGSSASSAAASGRGGGAYGSAVAGTGVSIAARQAVGTSAVAPTGRAVTAAEGQAAAQAERDRHAVTWMTDPAPKPGSAAGGAGVSGGIGKYLPPPQGAAGAGPPSSAGAAAGAVPSGTGVSAAEAAAYESGLEAAPSAKRKPPAANPSGAGGGAFGSFSGW